MSLNLPKNYRFTYADYQGSIELEYKNPAGGWRDDEDELTPQEQELIFVLGVANEIWRKTKLWPTVSETLAVIEEQEKLEKEQWEKTHAAEEAEWMAQHAKDVAAREQTQ